MSGFADEVQLHARGGDGGAGSVSFRREAHVPRGGPDGGDGGDGGSVWLVADHNVASLLAFRDHPHRRAGSGVHGQGKRRHGRSGDDLEVMVPPGTVVRGPEGEVLADLVHAGDRWQAARGGQGGRGNTRFLSNRRRAPSFAEQGEPGEERWLDLELKLLADVALVGFPNVGKSTLISRISAAKPRIADYPFTTLEPNLGVVRTDDGAEIVVADVPGLIEGASEGRGLGHRFLRHVERARVLAVLVDLSPLAERPPAEQQEVLLGELEAYRPELVERPRVVVGSRADMAPDVELGGAEGPEVDHVVSAVTGRGVPALVGHLVGLVQEARAATPVAEGFVVHRPAPAGVSVARDEDGALRVVGRPAERVVALSDVTTPDAQAYVRHRLDQLGVPKALARAGAKAGDEVRIGTFSFDYVPDDGTG
ncbi:MAG TPA: GTPase ObgE [Acidimicrobiales bacterium]|nr:GTPase ObgE [Acidimicrobiales bacterium]